jgi:hypothetical protein
MTKRNGGGPGGRTAPPPTKQGVQGGYTPSTGSGAPPKTPTTGSGGKK